MRVSDFIAKRLMFLGCQDVYMVTGGAAMHLNDSFGLVFKDNMVGISIMDIVSKSDRVHPRFLRVLVALLEFLELLEFLKFPEFLQFLEFRKFKQFKKFEKFKKSKGA